MMNATHARPWSEANQAYLADALGRLKRRLRRHADRVARASFDEDGERQVEVAPDEDFANGPIEDGFTSALDALGRAFVLSGFELDLLLLCAGVELDSSIGPLCAEAQGDLARGHPTFSLALAVLARPHWSAISPESPLRRWRLIEVGPGPSLVSSPLRIDERVLHQLAGVPYLDERLAVMVEPLGAGSPESIAGSHADLAERISDVWTSPGNLRRSPIIQLCGPDPADRRVVALAASARLGLPLAALPAELIPSGAAELDALVRLWEREAALNCAVLMVECDESERRPDASSEPPRARGVARLLERMGGWLIVSDRDRRRIAHRLVLSFDVARPTRDEQRAAWRSALDAGGVTGEIDEAVDAVVGQFSLGLTAIRSAATEAIVGHEGTPGAGIGREVWDVCRAYARTHMDDLAQRIESTAGWDDLVLPPMQADAVRAIALQVRNRVKVHDAWGFAASSPRGLGISALFSGASGTGKTLAAEVLANELRLDLYRIDLSSVVSKYIGETEKNLRRVFDTAEDGGAVLLFDEADALFGKRSEVQDSHDRYANIEVSYLLQRMEAFGGLAILTTNLKSSLDSAFLRRIRFVVQFPYPDLAQRAEIWRRAFPASTPTEGLDPLRLARLNVPGGNIRNIALNAAFLAADARQPVRMSHVIEAARFEYAKLERLLTEAEIGGPL